MTKENLTLDPLLHQPVRTRLVAYLATRGETTFTDLKNTLSVTDGNLEAHIKKLVSAEYLAVKKQQGAGRPQSLYSLSKLGITAFHNYISALNELFPEIHAETEKPERGTKRPSKTLLNPT